MTRVHKLKDTKIIIGDVFDALKKIPDGSVHCAVTSPPYWRQRRYGVSGEIGREGSPEDYVSTIVRVLSACRPKLREDATFWLNIGDCRSKSGVRKNTGFNERCGGAPGQRKQEKGREISIRPGKTPRGNLLLIPDKLTIALQDDGWIVAQKIIWAKSNPMPDSAGRRPADTHEYILLLWKSLDAYCDGWAIREPSKASTIARLKRGRKSKHKYEEGAPGQPPHTITKGRENDKSRVVQTTRNSWNVWHIGTEGYKGSHYAVFPREIPYRAIKAGTSEFGCCVHCGAPFKRILEKVNNIKYKKHTRRSVDNPKGEAFPQEKSTIGAISVRRTKCWSSPCSCPQPVYGTDKPVVLDPFVGSGTTLAVARSMNCRSIGIDLDPKNLPLIKKRIRLGYIPKVPLGEETYE